MGHPPPLHIGKPLLEDGRDCHRPGTHTDRHRLRERRPDGHAPEDCPLVPVSRTNRGLGGISGHTRGLVCEGSRIQGCRPARARLGVDSPSTRDSTWRANPRLRHRDFRQQLQRHAGRHPRPPCGPDAGVWLIATADFATSCFGIYRFISNFARLKTTRQHNTLQYIPK